MLAKVASCEKSLVTHPITNIHASSWSLIYALYTCCHHNNVLHKLWYVYMVCVYACRKMNVAISSFTITKVVDINPLVGNDLLGNVSSPDILIVLLPL